MLKVEEVVGEVREAVVEMERPLKEKPEVAAAVKVAMVVR